MYQNRLKLRRVKELQVLDEGDGLSVFDAWLLAFAIFHKVRMQVNITSCRVDPVIVEIKKGLGFLSRHGGAAFVLSLAHLDMAMKFRSWLEGGIETGTSLNAQFPEILPNVNKGAATTASDGVLRTGLQPQVDSKEIHTQQKDTADRIQAVDAALQRCDEELPQGKQDEYPKVNKFKQMWDQLKKEWDKLKMNDDIENKGVDTDGALGNTRGDEKMLQMMQQHPNMAMVGPDNYPHGPGTFGMS